MREPTFAIRIGIGMIAAWLLGWLFLELGEELSGTILGALERRLMELIASERERDETAFMIVLSTVGSAGAYSLIAGALAIVLWRQRRRLSAIMLLVVVVGAGLLAVSLKLVYNRPRPDISAVVGAPLASFPSGHALAAVAVYGFMAYLISCRARWYWSLLVWGGYCALALGIGISRVYLGVHWPTDVIGGMLAGTVWLVASILAYETLIRVHGRRRECAHRKEE